VDAGRAGCAIREMRIGTRKYADERREERFGKRRRLRLIRFTACASAPTNMATKRARVKRSPRRRPRLQDAQTARRRRLAVLTHMGAPVGAEGWRQHLVRARHGPWFERDRGGSAASTRTRYEAGSSGAGRSGCDAGHRRRSPGSGENPATLGCSGPRQKAGKNCGQACWTMGVDLLNEGPSLARVFRKQVPGR